MTFEDLLDQAIAMLQRRGRVTYRALKRQFNLDDDYLEDLKIELIKGQRLAVDEAGEVLVWRGDAAASSLPVRAPIAPVLPGQDVLTGPDAFLPSPPITANTPTLPSLAGERRQVTVLFADISGFTALAETLDPEVVRNVMNACFARLVPVVEKYAGTVDKFIGDAIMAVFGAPVAQENDAARAVYTALEMLEALAAFNADQGTDLGLHCGLNTGLVIAGGIGTRTYQAYSVMGDAVNLAARLEDASARGEILVGRETYRLTQAQFTYEPLAPIQVKGKAEPVPVYRVLGHAGERQRGLGVVCSSGLLPLVGREQEVGLLWECWAQVKDGTGQVVLLSGEAGIGKSRLVQELTDHLTGEAHTRLECQCSPYHQHSALYPMIDLLERVVLRFERQESPQQKLGKLEGHLVQYDLPLAEAVPLCAPLLSLPLPADYAPLLLSPEQQRQQTLQALLTILLRIAAQQPVLLVMEDLHWVDPSTLELLSLLVDQGPTARILALLTFRPDFSPPWTGRSHLTQVTLHRLTRPQAVEMIRRVAHHKALPAEVVEQIVAKTDGVPLFVEELTKMVLESGLLREREDHYELTGPLSTLAIPATLHDSLMARLDRLATVKGLAQLAATLGREFSYALLRAVSPWDEATVHQGLHQLVEAEFLYQRGVPPQATYIFKHALIQATAYQSLLKSTRQQYHRRVAQVLEARFPETRETQPELLAHHSTEAGLSEQAVGYWQQASQRAVEHSAHVEAISHLTRGLEVLTTLPDTPERIRQELDLQTTLGQALMVVKGYAVPEGEHAYARASELCRQIGDTPHLFQVLWGLWRCATTRAEFKRALVLGEQLLSFAQHSQAPAHLMVAHRALGSTWCYLGELITARGHLEQGIAFYRPQQPPSQALHAVTSTVASCLSYVAWICWLLGYPDQAVRKSQEAVALAQEISNPLSMVAALYWAARLHQLRREARGTQERAEAVVALATKQGFSAWMAEGTIHQGWALAVQGQGEGIRQLLQGFAAWQTTGAQLQRPYFLVLLAEAYGRAGQAEEGLHWLAEALADTTGERWWEAEGYRLQGELLLQRAILDASQAEACFQQALASARRQQAKSWELRTAMSLSRLWQQQGKHQEAHALLAPIYDWFTEGFDTADLQEAKALLEALT